MATVTVPTEPIEALQRARTVELFAGPGGWDEGARIGGLDLGIVGAELGSDACATAIAAGHRRVQADVRGLDPRLCTTATGLIASPVCPTFSASGLRSGTTGDDYQWALDCITAFGEGDDEDWATLPDRVVDPRTALVVETIRWAMLMPNIQWMVAEQVPAVEYIWEDIAAELYAAGWEYVNVLEVEAWTFGAAARRRRTFMIANRYTAGGSHFSEFGIRQYLPPSMAQALGWTPGHQVRTRNNRRPTGGNLFSADGPSWCLTGKARSWERDTDQLRLTAAEAGLLQGFRRDYPWQGSRTSQFHQAGDIVSPLVATAMLSAVSGVRSATFEPLILEHLRQIYPGAVQPSRWGSTVPSVSTEAVA